MADPLDKVFSDLNSQIVNAQNGVYTWGYLSGALGNSTNVTTVDNSTVAPVIQADASAQRVLDSITGGIAQPDSITKAPVIVVVAVVLAIVFWFSARR